MALSPYALVSLVEAREFLGGELDGELERITALVNAASEYCERKIEDLIVSRAHAAEVFDGTGGVDLALPHQPVTAVASVEFLSTSSPEAWAAPVDFSVYPILILTPARRRIAFRNLVFPYGFRNVRVTYTAGYTGESGAAPLPFMLKEACLEAVKALRDAREDDGASSVTSLAGGVGAQTVSYLDRALPKTTLDLLAAYRRRRF